MANRNKFEEMLERLINEDQQGAEDLFHEIVVEKSRQIYEGLLEAEWPEDDTADPSDDLEMDVSADEEEMDMEGEDDLDLDMEDEEDMDMGDDADVDDLRDEVFDLKAKLEELEDEFEAMMKEEGDEEDDEDMEMDFDLGSEDEEDEGEDEEDMDMDMEDDMGDEEEPKKESRFRSDADIMKEYVEKVEGGHGAEKKGKSETAGNTKSAVAGKNDMGGTSGNIAQCGKDDSTEANKGDLKGSALPGTTKAQTMNTGNVNVPGGKAAKTAYKSKVKGGHGSEKRGEAEKADKGAVSTLTKVSTRAK